jgi:hypothetical protein
MVLLDGAGISGKDYGIAGLLTEKLVK